jgi:hypothetical protein
LQQEVPPGLELVREQESLLEPAQEPVVALT